MSPELTSRPIRLCLAAALVIPWLCAAATPPAGAERARCKRAARTVGVEAPSWPAACRRVVRAPPVAPRDTIRPGPLHRAWFDDYPAKGAGLIER